MDNFEKPRESCGIFGIYGHPEAAKLTYFGLYALQHRGQESCGIAVVVRGGNIVGHNGMGLVPDVFDITHLEHLEGESAIGHVRYSTTGSSILSNAQPVVIHHRQKAYALAHNGNLVNAHHLKLDLVNAELIRELDPGEIVIIGEHGIRSIKIPAPGTRAFCIFEFIYFARPDSTIYGQNVYLTRKAHGRRLAQEAPVDADLVMPFPDSGTYAALGYSEASGIPFEMAMIRNHYVGRTFIQPTQSMRDFGVRIKLNPVKKLLEGKDIIIIEDSIIRGTTVKTRVKALRELGVNRIHMRVSGPPHRYPCHYGIDFSTRGELIAANMSVENLKDFLDLDSLHYLSLDGLLKSTGIQHPENHFCKACFDGCYPVEFDEYLSKHCLESR